MIIIFDFLILIILIILYKKIKNHIAKLILFMLVNVYLLFGMSAKKKYQIELFFKKMFLSKKDVNLII
jgi:hypothetical protein